VSDWVENTAGVEPDEVEPDERAPNRAERRTRAGRRIDFALAAAIVAKLEARGLTGDRMLADAALCHHRRTKARKQRRKTARAARRRNR
jgi:hypothetical protein